MTRRKFLKAAAIVTATAASGVGLAHAAPRRVRLTRHRLSWPGGQRLRVAQLTDLHVGWGTPSHLLEQALQLTRRANPDLVVLTGDYLNRSLKHLGRLRSVVRRLPRPCVATLGNHDHWSGASAVQEALEREGVVVLRNANARVSAGGCRIPVVGIDDGFTQHDDVDRAFSGVRSPESALVLTHFPDTADRIATRGGRIVLSGHTHGGQIQLPLVTRAVAHLAGSRYIAGWYELGRTRLYVNAGIGSSAIRFRYGDPAVPEVALFEFS